jgi:hypothetical protein
MQAIRIGLVLPRLTQQEVFSNYLTGSSRPGACKLKSLPRGYAIVANEMIKAINLKYKASIPTAELRQHRAVVFP